MLPSSAAGRSGYSSNAESPPTHEEIADQLRSVRVSSPPVWTLDTDTAIALHFARACEAYTQQRWEELLVESSALIAENYQEEWAISARARANLALERWEPYFADCLRLHQLHPIHVDFLKGVINGCFHLNRHPEVILYATRLLTLGSDSTVQIWALKKRCRAFWANQEREQALSDMVAILKLDPQDSEAWIWGCRLVNADYMSMLESKAKV